MRMRDSLSQHGFVTAARVDSYSRPVKSQDEKQSKEQDLTQRIAQLIPYWPKTISPKALADHFGITAQSVSVRVSSCHSRYLIFSDKGRLSRLKDDLSNCI